MSWRIIHIAGDVTRLPRAHHYSLLRLIYAAARSARVAECFKLDAYQAQRAAFTAAPLPPRCFEVDTLTLIYSRYIVGLEDIDYQAADDYFRARLFATLKVAWLSLP